MIRDVHTGRPSYTATMVVVGFLIINLKLLLSGIQITEKIKMSDFTGIDYSACLTALGGIHIFNKSKSNTDTSEEQ
jgi:hypothetical protein